MAVNTGSNLPGELEMTLNTSDVAVITKIDLAAAVEFDWDAALNNIHAVRPKMQVLRVSAKTGEGMEEFVGQVAHLRRVGNPPSESPQNCRSSSG